MIGYGEWKTQGGETVLTGAHSRSRVKAGWGFYNSVAIIWIDDSGSEVSRCVMPVGKFHKQHKPKPTGRRRVFDHGTQRFV